MTFFAKTPFLGCEEDWISGHGLCYRLMTQFATFDRAEEKCNQMDAHLLTIENQDESDFISDWLLAVTSLVCFFEPLNLHT